MSDVGGALASMLGGGYVNYFSLDGRSYKVIPQVQQRFRLNPQQLLDYYIRTADGIAGAAVDRRHVSTKTVPESLNHFQQLNSATIQGVAVPGVAQGDALDLPAGPGRARRCRRAIRSTTAGSIAPVSCRNPAASSSPSASR